ncbi:MAG: hypothetical protein WDM87_02880 [Terracidiphilus sp.]
MRRFLTLVCLLGLALPAGISISGCVRNPAGNYCNGLGYGLKDNVVANLTLQPQIAGISLAYGQTTAIQQPTATTCKGGPASISGGSLSYGTSNNQLIDIAPNGSVCAGTWNRNSGGGIADYTYCNFPNPLPSTRGLPYALAYITASADGVTSNPVTVYVHAPISSINLVTQPLQGAPSQGCYSQNQSANLDAQAFYSLNGTQTLLCAPGSATLPECSSSIGTLSFASGNSSVATINPTNNVITAEQPGTTVITAAIAQSASSAGYFSTCPPKSISISLANGSTKGVIAQGALQNLTTTAIDTQGNSIPVSLSTTSPPTPSRSPPPAPAPSLPHTPALPLSPRSASRRYAILLPSTSSDCMEPGSPSRRIPSTSLFPEPPATLSGSRRQASRNILLPSSFLPVTQAPLSACPTFLIPWSWIRREARSTSGRRASS